jgi:hypothetical protein
MALMRDAEAGRSKPTGLALDDMYAAVSAATEEALKTDGQELLLEAQARAGEPIVRAERPREEKK